MEKRVFGKTGLEVSALGFGGAEIGFEGAAAETVATLLNAALDAGLNVIDTAECYINGTVSSEELIGKAVSTGATTTICSPNAATPLASTCRIGTRKLESQIDRSLQRLKTDHLDLVQFHGCPLELLRQGDVSHCCCAPATRAKPASSAIAAIMSARYAIECGAFDTLQSPSTSPISKSSMKSSPPPANTTSASSPNAPSPTPHGPRPPPQSATITAPISNACRNSITTSSKISRRSRTSSPPRFTLSSPASPPPSSAPPNPAAGSRTPTFSAAGPLPEAQIAAIRARWHEVAPPEWNGQDSRAANNRLKD